MSTNTDIEPIVQGVRGRLKEIEDKLLEQDPNLPVHLSAIHQTLLQYEELVHILSEEDISILIRGQKKHAGVQLVSQAVSKKTGPKTVKRGESIADDL